MCFGTLKCETIAKTQSDKYYKEPLFQKNALAAYLPQYRGEIHVRVDSCPQN